MLSVTKRFSFESAHWLTGHPHCGSVHGHSFILEVTVQGVMNGLGMVVDFHVLKEIVDPYVDTLDHATINDVMLTDKVPGGWDYPTAERLLLWFVDRIEQGIKNCEEWPKEASCSRLRLWETVKNFAECVPNPVSSGPYLLDEYLQTLRSEQTAASPEEIKASLERLFDRVRKETHGSAPAPELEPAPVPIESLG